MNCDIVGSIKLPEQNTISIEAFAEIYKDSEQMKNKCLVDCRNEVQFGITHLDQAVNIPFKKAVRDSASIREVAGKHEKVYIMCRRGVDSKDLTDKLINGDDAISNVVNVEGGISGWSKSIDPSIPYY